MSEQVTRVLIVEDDPDFAESLMIALGVRNCHVDIARTGEEAINKETLTMASYAGPSARRAQFERELA